MHIAGHRGAAGLAPENTLPAFRRAMELGIRLVELDVRLSRDGRPVCFHDERLDRVTAASGRVSEWDGEALCRVQVLPGSFGGAFPDARIPLLADVIREMPPDCRFLVELKPDADRPDQAVSHTLEALGDGGALSRCRVISFDPNLLRRVAAAPVGARTGILVGRDAGALLLPLARTLAVEAVHPHHEVVDADLVRAARIEGFLVSAWTVNTPEEVRRLAALGVDEITTDYPDRALEARDSSEAVP